MYFVTLCTNQRLHLFEDVVDGTMHRNRAGVMVQSVWDDVCSVDRGTAVDSIAVMPNHVHAIIALVSGPAGVAVVLPGERPRESSGVLLGDVVKEYKNATANVYRRRVRRCGWRPFAGTLWQTNYYEHIIRDAESLARIRKYIAENPKRWTIDKDNSEKQGDDEFDLWLSSMARGQAERRAGDSAG